MAILSKANYSFKTILKFSMTFFTGIENSITKFMRNQKDFKVSQQGDFKMVARGRKHKVCLLK
jgi:hypothetical protein